MLKLLWKALLVSTAVFGVSLVISAGVLASETPLIAEALSQIEEDATDADTLPKVATASKTGLELPTVAEMKTRIPMAVSQIEPAFSDLAEGKVTVAEMPDASTTIAMPAAIGEKMPADADVLEQVLHYSNEGSVDDPLGQVTNVTQLRDVQPGDWAYAALQELVERYGCSAGYPDGTFRGNRALSRYEFAAGLNACWKRNKRVLNFRFYAVAPRADSTVACHCCFHSLLSIFALICKT